MKFPVSLSTLVLLAASCLAVTVSFDPRYDDAGGDMNNVACSNGPRGLSSRFPTFGNVPSFPRIGGAQVIEGFNSVNCGTCWTLTFNGTKINVLAIDHTDRGFNIAKAAMNQLTKGQADFLGRVDATVAQVAASSCGL